MLVVVVVRLLLLGCCVGCCCCFIVVLVVVVVVSVVVDCCVVLLLICCWVVGLLGCWVVGLCRCRCCRRCRRCRRHRPCCRCCGCWFLVGKNNGQQYCWCSLMWLMPLKSLSNCDYELNFYLRLILGPIHSNQVMGTDPIMEPGIPSRIPSIRPIILIARLKTPPRHTHVPPVQNNQPGTGFGSQGKSVGLGPSVTLLG